MVERLLYLNEKIPHIHDIKPFLDTIFLSEQDDSTVFAVPLRCGIGKSTYTHDKIREVCNSTSPEGLIVVTDSVDRLKEYVNSTDDPTASLIAQYPDKIAVLTADNVSTEMQRQAYCKVLLMTTQRYFQLTRDEIKNLLHYSGGRRTTIIIDEKPLLKQVETITFKNLTDALAALFNIDDSVERNEKNWCIDQWRAFVDHIRDEMNTGETICEKQYFRFWFTDSWTSLTTANDDKRFFRFIEAHKAKISREAYKTIQLCRQLIEDGAIFDCHKIQSGEYKKQFWLCVDNRDKLINLGSKVIVLDGSADVSPEYQVLYINMVDCSRFNVPLTNLEIVCVNANTSKSKLKPDSAERESTIDAIKKYLEKHCPQVPVFTYLQNDKDFHENVLRDKKNPSEYVKRHFGAIRGVNDYRNCAELAQIGLNRYDELTYFLMTELSEDKKKYLKSLKPEQGAVEFEKIFALYEEGTVSTTETMLRSILADIEQNLFRSAIRNVNFDGEVRYWMFFDTVNYAALVEMMKKRYGSLGAKITVRDKPMTLKVKSIEKRQTTKDTAPKKFIRWCKNQQPGRRVTSDIIAIEAGLSREDFKNLKKSPACREILRKMKADDEPEEHGVYITIEIN